jgi:protocatechuate 3,4-dioxygenase beta subunit
MQAVNPEPIERRNALRLLGAGIVTAAVAAACSSDSSGATDTTTNAPSSTSGESTTATTAATSTTASGGSSDAIPEETAGPFPADGSNGPNVLTQDGVVRADIRSSFGSGSGVAEGVPLTIQFTVVDAATGAAKSGAAVYAWHCDKDGEYSVYSSAIPNENYLRGVQAAGGDGVVRFTSIFPGCYSGRWPHIHFEVYSSVDDATGGGNPLATSQIALPEDMCSTVYATDGYEPSARNLPEVSLDSDMVFRDGWTAELATMTGSVDSGLVAALNVPV